jgi:nuclear transport factor 2 (NTF2) superfamily protein
MPSLAISSVEPIVEAWVPTQGRIAGRFTAAWRTPLGEIASAEAESNYQIKSRKKMTQLVHRFIDIDARVDGRKFTLDQRSFTFQRLFVDALTCGVSERR